VAFAAAISEHPVPATALGEVVGHVLEKVGEGPDLVCLFVSPQHAGALEDMAAAVQTILDPKVLIGCAAEAVIGPGVEIEGGSAVSIWAGNVGPVEPVRLKVVDAPAGGKALSGWPINLGYVPAAAVILGDPFTFPASALFSVLNGAGGFPRVAGAMASGALGPGGNRLVLGEEVHEDGAVGVLIGANDDVWIEHVVSQGCRPIGSPFAVTRAEGNVIYELGGVPALSRLTDMVKSSLNDAEMGLAQTGLLVGIVVDEHKDTFGPGDFLIRTVIDTDIMEESITVGQRVEVGTTVQFHIRDSAAAGSELNDRLTGKEADAALIFTSSGRGSRLFEEPDHDAAMIAEALDDPPAAGFFSASEFGPIGGRNLEHGFSASLALFTDRRTH